MKERPILFSAPMVRALLDGSKTQTRRVLKPAHDEQINPIFFDGAWQWATKESRRICPYGASGDRLWVKETFVERSGDLFYRADDGAEDAYEVTFGERVAKWKPSIFMPRDVSRITLEVTDVRVERLQAISEADAMAEGVSPVLVPPDRGSAPHVEGYRALWDQINGAGSWAPNPWVWVVAFRSL